MQFHLYVWEQSTGKIEHKHSGSREYIADLVPILLRVLAPGQRLEIEPAKD